MHASNCLPSPCSLCNDFYREPEDPRAEEGGFAGEGGHVGKVFDDQSDGPLWSEGDLKPLPLVLLQLLDRKLHMVKGEGRGVGRTPQLQHLLL